MPDEASSLHLRNTHELFLLIPLKYGFIEDGPERRVSYATRLRVLLGMLFSPTQGAVEKSLMPRASFADELQNLYHFHYGVVDRLQQSQLLLSATFDSSWEAYFRNLVDKVGPILDSVFCHCQGFEGRSCEDGYEAFADFVREHQVQAGILYAATPDLTTDDLRILRDAARGEPLKTPLPPAQVIAEAEERIWRARYSSEDWQGQDEFKRLRLQSIIQFVDTVREVQKIFPEKERIDAKRSARQIFDTAVKLVATSIAPADLAQAVAVLQEEIKKDPNNPEFVSLGGVLSLVSPPDPNAPVPKTSAALCCTDDDSGQDDEFDPSRIQQNIVESSGSNEGLLVLLRFPAHGAAALLNRLARMVRDDTADSAVHVNVGLTYNGLRRCGLDDGTLEQFPKEFRLGMEKRAGSLGDVGWPNHPDYWHEVGDDNRRLALASIDVVVVLHRKRDRTESLKDVASNRLGKWWKQAAVVAYLEDLARFSPDHFGYKSTRDNQPRIHGQIPAQFDNTIPAGELVLGYRNSHGETSRAADAKLNPHTNELFFEGTFLVVRKLAQSSAAFKKIARSDKSRATVLGVAKPPLAAGDDYTKLKPPGASPGDSHVRRVNPRFFLVPRIMRRSFSYGPRTGKERPVNAVPERGHIFMAYNASIAQQYEVLQRWINGGNITGLLSNQTDRLASQQVLRGAKDTERKFAVPHVTLRWGMYLFVPSKDALDQLSDVASARSSRATAGARKWRTRLRESERARIEERGSKLLGQLDAITDSELAKQSWKQLFEEQTYEEDARAVWAAIRARGGRKQTPYALLVGDRAGVELVLGDDGSKFSVRGYRNRLLATIGDFYLGLDSPRCPYAAQPQGGVQDASYATVAHANDVLRRRLPTAKMFDVARQHAIAFLEAPAPLNQFDLRDLARQVVGAIARDYVGLPSAARSSDGPVDPTLQKYLDHFINITRYLSFPHPENWLIEKALESGRILRRDYGTDFKSWRGIADALHADNYAGRNPIAFRNAVIGANVGFVPPSISMLVGTMSKWIENGDIEHPRVYSDRDSLRSALIRDLAVDATFTTIFRTAIEGNGIAKPGSVVVVGVQSAYEDDENDDVYEPVHWLFGGDYSNRRRARAPRPPVGTHGCPVAAPAVEILAGALQGLAERIQEVLGESPTRTLVRLGPVRYGFQDVLRVRPGVPLAVPRGPEVGA